MIKSSLSKASFKMYVYNSLNPKELSSLEADGKKTKHQRSLSLSEGKAELRIRTVVMFCFLNYYFDRFNLFKAVVKNVRQFLAVTH